MAQKYTIRKNLMKGLTKAMQHHFGQPTTKQTRLQGSARRSERLPSVALVLRWYSMVKKT